MRLVLKEWQFADGSVSSNNTSVIGSQRSMNRPSDDHPRTGRKIKLTVVEGRDLVVKDKAGKSNAYVKLQYGKVCLFVHWVSLVNFFLTTCFLKL